MLLNGGAGEDCWESLWLQGNCKGICKRNHKGNQPWIFIGRTDAEAATLGHLIRRADSLENSLMLGKIEDKRRKGRHRIRWLRWLDSITNSMDMNLSKLEDGVGQGSLACGQTQLRGWTIKVYWLVFYLHCLGIGMCQFYIELIKRFWKLSF